MIKEVLRHDSKGIHHMSLHHTSPVARFVFPIKYNPMLKHRTSCVAFAENTSNAKHMYIYIYICIHVERERERERLYDSNQHICMQTCTPSRGRGGAAGGGQLGGLAPREGK